MCFYTYCIIVTSDIKSSALKFVPDTSTHGQALTQPYNPFDGSLSPNEWCYDGHIVKAHDGCTVHT